VLDGDGRGRCGGHDEAPAAALLRLYLEIGRADGWCLVHCPDLPGAGFKAPSREAALALAPGRLSAELDWLARTAPALGRRVCPGASWPFAVAGEVVLDVPAAEGDTEATFEPDLEPLDDAYLAHSLSYLEASRRALQGLVGGLPDECLSWRPAPGKRTVAEVLGHIADAEAFYAVRLERPEAATPELWEHYAGRTLGLGPFERLARTREMVAARLGALSEDDRRRVATFDPHQETWTARKVLRRLVWHERYHTRQLEAYLTT
jgi:uncharacterized damage-inducible protein DinB